MIEKNNFDVNSMYCKAAKHNKLAVIQWLIENKYNCTRKSNVVTTALDNNSTEAIFQMALYIVWRLKRIISNN